MVCIIARERPSERNSAGREGILGGNTKNRDKNSGDAVFTHRREWLGVVGDPVETKHLRISGIALKGHHIIGGNHRVIANHLFDVVTQRSTAVGGHPQRVKGGGMDKLCEMEAKYAIDRLLLNRGQQAPERAVGNTRVGVHQRAHFDACISK